MTDLLRSRIARALAMTVILMVMSASASAREVRMQGPNGDGGACPDQTAQDADETPAPPASKRQAIRGKPKATPMVRSGGDNVARPRWHSILPGMFR